VRQVELLRGTQVAVEIEVDDGLLASHAGPTRVV
jgi:hypothetical protein